MRIAHLTASTLYGGPERQMLGLAEHLPAEYHTQFWCFREGNRCQPFREEIVDRGFSCRVLDHDTPRLRSAIREIAELIVSERIDLLLCHGYKSNLLGRIAAQRVGCPVIAVSRGWTAENRKVRFYEWLDRWNLKYMDRVVCVSEGQARKVRACGVSNHRIDVIRNSARPELFEDQPEPQTPIRAYFPSDLPVDHIVVAAGRLSPEKGFDVLIEAASHVLKSHPRTGFLLWGEGPERERLTRLIHSLGIRDRFLLPGFSIEIDRLVSRADMMVLPSYTEGLPNVVLEASALGIAVVATAVGGTPEVIDDGESGMLVPPGSSEQMARSISQLLSDKNRRIQMGRNGRTRMAEQFSFDVQASAYARLFDELTPQLTGVA